MASFRLLHRLSARFVLPLFVGVLVLAGCGDGQGEADAPSYEIGEALSDSTIALIVSSEYGTDTLAAQQYRREAKQRLGRLPPQEQTPDTVQAIHRDLVRSVAAQHVMQGRAREQNTEVDTAEVTKRLEQVKQRYQSEEQFQQQLAQSNITVDSLRSSIASQLQIRSLQQQMTETAESPSEEEIDAYSKENARVRAQHILLRVGEDAPQTEIDSARQAAAALVDSAQAGVDFSALARRHSEGPSARQGGDLGFFTRDEMVQPFSEAAFALSDSGDVAPEPVRTEFGFHVIRLTSAEEPMAADQARKEMMQTRRQDAFDRELNKLLETATVRANPDVAEAGFYE